jgi:hypothetical protein
MFYFAHIAQAVEHFLGKEEVAGSIPAVGTNSRYFNLLLSIFIFGSNPKYALNSDLRSLSICSIILIFVTIHQN